MQNQTIQFQELLVRLLSPTKQQKRDRIRSLKNKSVPSDICNTSIQAERQRLKKACQIPKSRYQQGNDREFNYYAPNLSKEEQEISTKPKFSKFKNFYKQSPSQTAQLYQSPIQMQVCKQLRRIFNVQSKEYTSVRPESHQMRSRQFSMDVRQRKSIQFSPMNIQVNSLRNKYAIQEYKNKPNYKSQRGSLDWIDFVFDGVNFVHNPIEKFV